MRLMTVRSIQDSDGAQATTKLSPRTDKVQPGTSSGDLRPWDSVASGVRRISVAERISAAIRVLVRGSRIQAFRASPRLGRGWDKM